MADSGFEGYERSDKVGLSLVENIESRLSIYDPLTLHKTPTLKNRHDKRRRGCEGVKVSVRCARVNEGQVNED